jgi:3-oxoacyl-[acyl-carrier protein] reductase
LFAINTKRPFFALQEAAKFLKDGGRIVNISTAGTRLAFLRITAYAGTKPLSKRSQR